MGGFLMGERMGRMRSSVIVVCQRSALWVGDRRCLPLTGSLGMSIRYQGRPGKVTREGRGSKSKRPGGSGLSGRECGQRQTSGGAGCGWYIIETSDKVRRVEMGRVVGRLDMRGLLLCGTATESMDARLCKWVIEMMMIGCLDETVWGVYVCDENRGMSGRVAVTTTSSRSSLRLLGATRSKAPRTIEMGGDSVETRPFPLYRPLLVLSRFVQNRDNSSLPIRSERRCIAHDTASMVASPPTHSFLLCTS
ncbi:hypothetical protein DB88DRAFT_244473 [Papiliotrema laurentii]|uniref:Uncharacterized protein n=1 Tax=Papiliotrema laurentii TaxID=5418 RepID=A0AAD9FRS7_PAPLA|nr:hypothetical protein DB88DRAFT_244473 [Papiliotrema laurentii]